MAEAHQHLQFKIFDLYDMAEVVITDEGLKNVINLDGKLILKSNGRETGKFGKTRVNVVERLAGQLGVAGHRGKKHKFELGSATGKYTTNMKIVLEALRRVAERTKQNPVQVLIKAIENSAPRDEITVIEYGGARYPQAVDVAPLRRVNLALKNIVHGASDRAFAKKKSIADGLVEEIILSAENSGDSTGCRKRNESEKQADSSR